jgi:hypothetical protein
MANLAENFDDRKARGESPTVSSIGGDDLVCFI